MTTALAAVEPTPLRPVPWRRLGWIAWRRYRPALATSTALLGIAALYLLIRGVQMRHAYAAVRACVPASSSACGFMFAHFHDTYGSVGPIGGILVFVPGLIGAFAGAPLLAREFETGTYRYGWTQGVGRMRWLTSLLVPGALGVLAVAAILGTLITWHNQPLIDSGLLPRLDEGTFPVTGIAVAGWALLGYSIGVTAGALIRRTVAALVATLAAWTGIAVAAWHLRAHDYVRPLVTRQLRIPVRDLEIHHWWTSGGVRVGQPQLDHVLQAVGAPTSASGNAVVKPGEPGIDPVQYLLHHGYTQWTSYQPDGRYWMFQGIELAWLAILSLLLLAITLSLVHRRNA